MPLYGTVGILKQYLPHSWEPQTCFKLTVFFSVAVVVFFCGSCILFNLFSWLEFLSLPQKYYNER